LPPYRLLAQWIQIRLGKDEPHAEREAWKSVDIILPARLSAREARDHIEAQIRINACDAGEFVQQFRIEAHEPRSQGWTKWTASYLPGPPGRFPTSSRGWH
jgi:hypothetical protein